MPLLEPAGYSPNAALGRVGGWLAQALRISLSAPHLPGAVWALGARLLRRERQREVARSLGPAGPRGQAWEAVWQGNKTREAVGSFHCGHSLTTYILLWWLGWGTSRKLLCIL